MNNDEPRNAPVDAAGNAIPPIDLLEAFRGIAGLLDVINAGGAIAVRLQRAEHKEHVQELIAQSVQPLRKALIATLEAMSLPLIAAGVLRPKQEQQQPKIVLAREVPRVEP